MLSLWCRTAGSRASNVGAALGDERCGSITCHKYDRAVYLTARQGLTKIVMVISKVDKSRRDVVSGLRMLAQKQKQPL